MHRRNGITALLLASVLLCGAWHPAVLSAQDGRYELRPAPDLWYNDVDGIRVGVRLQGRMEGMFEESPHRLNLGVWLGTWMPDHPVSYRLSFTEPIPTLSGFGSEAGVNLLSSMRTGLHRHRVSFNKRWQQGFDEQNRTTLKVHSGVEQRFEREYLPWTQLWNEEWLWLSGIAVDRYGESAGGRYSSHVTATGHAGPDAFVRLTAEYRRRVAIGSGFSLRGRIFGGTATAATPPQYRFLSAFRTPAGWVEEGLTRAKGTIPQPWMTGGSVQVAGGPNLRGYTRRTVERLNEGTAPLYASFGSVNLELNVPNPLSPVLGTVPVIGRLMTFRSYLFGDSGTGTGEGRMLSDAGVGFLFSLNIPDHHGRPRGVVIRYDIPVWLSHPGSEPAFRFRNVIGIGAVITF